MNLSKETIEFQLQILSLLVCGICLVGILITWCKNKRKLPNPGWLDPSKLVELLSSDGLSYSCIRSLQSKPFRIRNYRDYLLLDRLDLIRAGIPPRDVDRIIDARITEWD
jgi:hypothetical protein